MFHQKARAKINLTLEVLGKRNDGYHELRSLVAFTDFGDDLSFQPGEDFSLTIDGQFASDLQGDNLIEKAAIYCLQRFDGISTGHFHLRKNLPVASGIGGGSADAAAALHLLIQNSNLDISMLDFPEIAVVLGADIPVCLKQKPVLMTGIGENLLPVDNFPALAAVLINPLAPVSTGTIFKKLNASPVCSDFQSSKSDKLSFSDLDEVLDYMSDHQNDLQSIAAGLEPAIGNILSLLEIQNGCQIARMSGSGATCFGVFKNLNQAQSAASNIKKQYPDWWVQNCVIR